LVRTEAIGINYIDVYYRSGHYKAPHMPFVPGMEACGTIEAVGENVTALRPGQRVAYASALGSYAEFVAVPVAKLVVVPDGVSPRQAAALLLQGMTAHYLANSTFALKKGDVALVHAGAGGVGLLLTQLAKAKGATVITTVSTERKAELSRGAGADHVIKYTEADFAAEVGRITDGRGADVVYDSVGKTTYEKSIDSLRPRGMFVLFGASSGPVPPIDLQYLSGKGSLFATRPTLVHYTSTPDEIAWRAGDLFSMVESGTLRTLIEYEYPLAEAARAHADLESRKTVGKLLLLP
jgi:NADPH2:quinone reductase